MPRFGHLLRHVVLAATLLAAAAAPARLSAQGPGPLSGQAPPAVLQLKIERIKAGSEARYDAAEREVAAVCRRLDCPHPYLVLESFGEPREAYRVTTYRTEDDVARIAALYEGNAALQTELLRAAAPKAALVESSVEVLARYRADLSDASPWLVGTLPFALVVDGAVAAGSGAVFDLPNGEQLAFIPVANGEDLQAIAAALGPAAKRFAVRAEWSKPASAWIIGNPALWPPSSRGN